MGENILAILITVRNANAAVSEANRVRDSFSEAGLAAKEAATFFKVLAVATLALGLALRAVGTDEHMYLMLRGLTHSSEIAISQIRAIRAESERGLFDKEELFQARKMFDETGASIKDLLPLAEELSLRSDKGLGEVAKVLGGLSGGGMARLGLFLRAAGITVNELRNAGLAITKNYQVSGSPDQVLKSLKAVLGKDDLAGALGGGLSAELKGTFASLTDFFRSIGDGLLPVIKPILSFLGNVLKIITGINDATHGWLTNTLIVVGAFKGLLFALDLLIKMRGLMKEIAIWEGIIAFLNNPWAAMAAGIAKAVTAMKAFASAEKLAAIWAAILDAFDGNWVALGVGIGVAAAVGAGVYFGGKYFDGGDEKNAPAAEQPKRRSDLEHLLNRQRAKAFA